MRTQIAVLMVDANTTKKKQSKHGTGGQKMRDNIMFIPAIILMVVEVKALVFLIWSWCDAKRRQRDEVH